MSLETLEHASRFLFEKPEYLEKKLVVVWHSGEPLATPIEFYEYAFAQMDKSSPKSITVENWIQTNATLLNQNWCDFIKRRQVKIGVSIDGPEWLHNLNRVDRAGRGTFTNVLRGIELLKRNDIAFSTIGVLSSASLDFAEELWRFYTALGVTSMAFNFEDIEGVHPDSSLRGAACFSRAESFFERLLHLRAEENPGVFIRELDCLLDGARDGAAEIPRIDSIPLSIIGIAWNGDVSTFSPELLGMHNPRYDMFSFGNVATDTLNSVMTNPKLLAVDRDIQAGIKQCRQSCEYFQLCGGGPPSSKLAQNGTFDSTETTACQFRIKTVGKVVFEFLEKKHNLAPQEGLGTRERLVRLSSLADDRLRRNCLEPSPGADPGRIMRDDS